MAHKALHGLASPCLSDLSLSTSCLTYSSPAHTDLLAAPGTYQALLNLRAFALAVLAAPTYMLISFLHIFQVSAQVPRAWKFFLTPLFQAVPTSH